MTGDIIEHEFEDELMLYDTDEDGVHVLNPTARFIYEQCKNTSDPSKIEQAVRNHFNLKPEQDVRKDIQRCLDELKEKGLLHREKGEK
jgi:hypothetical protein